MNKETLEIIERMIDDYVYHLEDCGVELTVRQQEARNELRKTIGKLPYMLITDSTLGNEKHD